ncbi:hypothetical protein HYX13_05410 [Candidatus Woesearchaeota archaeon]|nr:hypothetical protein [Candidatus Woesearchaeota archaeon]
MEELIRITPDKEKAKSILKMVETTLEMIQETNQSKFPSHVTKEYYDVVRELVSVLLLLDGYKTLGEGAHKRMIEYLEKNYKEFDSTEIIFLDDLRVIRNKITYDGFFVKEEYIERRKERLLNIVKKLNAIINKKM